MDNTWQFVRHILPGAVYGVLALIGLLFLSPEWTLEHIKKLGDKDSAILLIGAGVFISGALGYIFAAIHHFVAWYCPIDAHVLDNRPLLKDSAANALMAELRTQNFISLEEQQLLSEDIPCWHICKVHRQRRLAMAISIGIWFQWCAVDKRVKKANLHLTHLGNIAQALGTARVASMFSCLTVLFMYVAVLRSECEIEISNHPYLIAIILLVVSGVFHDGWQRTGILNQVAYDLAWKRAAVFSKL